MLDHLSHRSNSLRAAVLGASDGTLTTPVWFWPWRPPALRIVAIDEALVRRAGQLAAQHALRGYGAVHLACALDVTREGILLATWDTALGAAATATGRLLVNDAS